MSLSSLGQIALSVTDIERSGKYYGEVLGLPKLFQFGGQAFFDCGGIRLMLQESESVEASSSVCHYFRTEGIEAACAGIEGRGAKIEKPPHLVATMPDHELWMAFFYDPDGHLLALMEERYQD